MIVLLKAFSSGNIKIEPGSGSAHIVTLTWSWKPEGVKEKKWLSVYFRNAVIPFTRKPNSPFILLPTHLLFLAVSKGKKENQMFCNSHRNDFSSFLWTQAGENHGLFIGEQETTRKHEYLMLIMVHHMAWEINEQELWNQAELKVSSSSALTSRGPGGCFLSFKSLIHNTEMLPTRQDCFKEWMG